MKSLFVKISLALLFLAADIIPAFSQNAYQISVKIDGLSDSLMLLAHYSGDKQFVTDTAYRSKNSEYVFSKRKELLPGMYFLAGENKNKLFDFIISDSKNISITGQKDKFPQSLKIKGSKENTLFLDYMNFLTEKQKQRTALNDLGKKYSKGSDSLQVIQNQLELLNDEVKRYINGIINSNPGSFMAVFLKAMQEPEIPEMPILSNGRPDSTFPFRYYRKHFWDNIDLSDDRVIRTPFLHSKVEQYISKLTVPAPDSLIKAIDHLFSMAGDNEEIFKYLMWYFTIKYETSEIMGYDAIFVHLVDKYYQDKKMGWMNTTVKENLIKKANAIRNVLIGKIAPEMILLDTLQNPVSLHSIKSDYTLIYFWDPDCSHCKKETPLLRDFYLKEKGLHNLEVYAVCMDTSWKDMKQYIRKNELPWINVNGFYSMTPDFRELYDVHSSPVMFLLDRNKKIIAKRLLSAQMESFIKQNKANQ